MSSNLLYLAWLLFSILSYGSVEGSTPFGSKLVVRALDMLVAVVCCCPPVRRQTQYGQHSHSGQEGHFRNRFASQLSARALNIKLTVEHLSQAKRCER